MAPAKRPRLAAERRWLRGAERPARGRFVRIGMARGDADSEDRSREAVDTQARTVRAGEGPFVVAIGALNGPAAARARPAALPAPPR